MNIVAMGGGSIQTGETGSMDRVLIELTGKAQPHVLFVPTASSDDAGYVRDFGIAYEKLGCTVSSLLLDSGDDPGKIAEADAIYVGGGNTKRMIALWKELGVDELLRTHLDAGKPVGGVSAGAICWFRVANSDWPQYENIPGVNTARLDGLGFVDLVVCPHTRDEGFRLSEFREMMRGEEGAGVGVDDCCAIQVRGDEYRIISSQEGAMAHRIEWVGDTLLESPLLPHSDFRPLSHLKETSNWGKGA